MGCNCKGGKRQILNNLNSQDHILAAKEVFNTIISVKEISEYDDYDRAEINNTFKSLYPNAKLISSTENAVENIKHAITNFKK